MNRSSELRLRLAFAEILATCLAATATTAVMSCSSGSIAGVIPEDGGTPGDGGQQPDGGAPNDGGTPPDGYASLCGKYSTPLIRGVEAEPPVDYIEERYEYAFRGSANVDGGSDGWKATDGNTAGTKCATATDKAACEEAVSAYRVLPTDEAECMSKYGGQVGCGVNYLLYTRKDEVGSAETFEQVKALFGAVSNIDEALLLAQQKNYFVSCPSEDRPVRAGLPESAYRARSDGGFDLRLLKTPDCAFVEDCYVHVDGAGNVQEEACTKTEASTGCAGRRPEGFVATPTPRDQDAGAYFAHMAELEAASVVAFRRLYDDLRALGAPDDLLARIQRAEDDEVRHTAATSMLARRYGEEPCTPRIDGPTQPATLFSLALENAREGCVRETYGALVAHVQAARASDPVVAACMRTIAEEETEHAALSWDIAAWLEAQLEAKERAVLQHERERAVAELAGALAQGTVSETTRRIAGLPRPEEATTLLASLEPTVLAA